MPKTRHHVYFRVHVAAQAVDVLTIWNAQGGSEPAFL
jgi:hypothetical protein